MHRNNYPIFKRIWQNRRRSKLKSETTLSELEIGLQSKCPEFRGRRITPEEIKTAEA